MTFFAVLVCISGLGNQLDNKSRPVSCYSRAYLVPPGLQGPPLKRPILVAAPGRQSALPNCFDEPESRRGNGTGRTGRSRENGGDRGSVEVH